MEAYLWVALGGAVGSVGRYGTSNLVERFLGADFPWATLIENVLGAFIVGAFVALATVEQRGLANPNLRLLVVVGFCGGFTTFSAFSLQTVHLIRDGQLMAAAGNIVASVAFCLIAVWFGFLAGNTINQWR